MCQIFAGQDPDNYSYVSRSIRLDGQVTSIRLEGLYWSILDEVAESQGFTTPGFYLEVTSRSDGTSGCATKLHIIIAVGMLDLHG